MMLKTLLEICKDNWKWRKQILHIALFDLKKKQRGAVLGMAWFIIKPAIYIFCFWFALAIGLRAGHGYTGLGYLLWLCSGIIPWFFMQEMLSTGIDALHKYSYLVNKVKFPISGIPAIVATSAMTLQLVYQVCLFIIYFIAGGTFDVYLLQVPLLLIIMFAFWVIASNLFSILSAYSKDFFNLMKALSTPFFWLSGVIYDLNRIDYSWIISILNFNPITFFVSGFRCAFLTKTWFWENTASLGGFIIVFLVTLLLMLFVYKRESKEVADVL